MVINEFDIPPVTRVIRYIQSMPECEREAAYMHAWRMYQQIRTCFQRQGHQFAANRSEMQAGVMYGAVCGYTGSVWSGEEMAAQKM